MLRYLCPWASFLQLVPKHCLGTRVRETPFRARHERRSPRRGGLGKRSFPGMRSQTEFGNEENEESAGNGTRPV